MHFYSIYHFFYHSISVQGGAEAIVAGAYFGTMYPAIAEQMQVVTFGTPAIGDSIFQRNYPIPAENIRRYVNENDLVPISLSFKFNHFGKVIKMPCKKNALECHRCFTYCTNIFSMANQINYGLVS